MKQKNYRHKFRQVVTDKFLVSVEDKREEMPKSNISVRIGYGSGLGDAMTLTLSEARELEKALHIALRRVTDSPEVAA